MLKVQNENYDLVISYVNMPKMDGINFVVKVRCMESFKYTPILMLTTDNTQDKKDNGTVVGGGPVAG
ncbi:MAG: two-component system chemotaxis response regulator CheY [Alteromonadaceae bacterium]